MIGLNDFQKQVSELLLRHRSLLDVLSKYDQSNASVHRSTIKAVTECGCIEIHGTKQNYHPEMTLEDAKRELNTQVQGKLCENCLEAISSELGRNVFYLAALCNLLDVDMQEIVDKESKKCSTLGLFNLS